MVAAVSSEMLAPSITLKGVTLSKTVIYTTSFYRTCTSQIYNRLNS